MMLFVAAAISLSAMSPAFFSFVASERSAARPRTVAIGSRRAIDTQVPPMLTA
jgi:hypothetical protein